MDKNIRIQLGSTKNINSTDVDTYDKLSLSNQKSEILEYDIRNILSVTEIFNQERQNTEIYRIYGGLEYLSSLNGLPSNYSKLEHFFASRKYSDILGYYGHRHILNSFDFYLLKPVSYKEIGRNDYITEFEVIAVPYNFEIFLMSYSRNVFDEPKYSFVINKDIDVSDWTDGFGFPITDLYIYPRYQTIEQEKIEQTNWTITGRDYKQTISSNRLDIGDKIIGNKINFYKTEYSQVIDEPQMHYITTPYINRYGREKELRWKYNPFIPLKLRYLSSEVNRLSIRNTDYESVSEIPSHAIDVGSGNMVWREILEQGYIDPLTGDGVDYPFVNKRRYLFSNIILDVIPDLEHNHTSNVFRDIQFGDDPIEINTSPQGDLNNIGKPCQ